MWKEVNDVRTTFCYDGETLVGQQTGQDDFVPIVHGPDGLIAFGETYYQFDPEGNVVHRLDADGELVNTSVYNAWGLATNVLPDGDPATVTDPFGYKGQVGYYTDHETGLILCTHRYYDPALGRWLTRDPIGYGGGVNLYGYCGNEPIGRGDDQGLDSYVFYDGAHFKKQALIEKDRLAKKYKTPVHMIDTRTTKQFVSSWNNMGKIGNRAVGIEGVSLLFHGKATTINIDWTKDQYLTTDPAGRTPAGRPAYYIGNLGDKPIEELRILTCNGGHLDVKDNVGRTFRRHLSYAGIISAYDGNLSYWPNGAPRLSLRKSQTKFFQIQKDVGAPLRNPKGEVYF